MQDNKIKDPVPAYCLPAVSGSVVMLTESKFRQFFSEFGNSAESYKDGEKIISYTFNRQIDNKFNLSYHLKFPQKNVQFNFWFDKICYLNSKESVTISFFNGNEPKEKDRLKNVLTTTDFNELKSIVDDVFLKYRYF